MQHPVVHGTHVWPIEGSGFSLVNAVADKRTFVCFVCLFDLVNSLDSTHMQHAVVLGTHVWPIEGSGFSLVSPVADERTLFRSSPVFRSPPVYHYGRNFQILSENYAAFFYPLLLKRDSI